MTLETGGQPAETVADTTAALCEQLMRVADELRLALDHRSPAGCPWDRAGAFNFATGYMGLDRGQADPVSGPSDVPSTGPRSERRR